MNYKNNLHLANKPNKLKDGAIEFELLSTHFARSYEEWDQIKNRNLTPI